MPALIDADVLISHLTGDPPHQTRLATALIETASDLVLLDVIAAECIYVLQSNYHLARTQIVELIRSALAVPAIRSEHPTLMERALAFFETEGPLSFQDAYLVAAAETSGV